MKVISHQELSAENRYQAIEILPDGKKIIAFGSSFLSAINSVLDLIFKK